MRIRFPLYGKILLWFFLDLVVVLAVLLFAFKVHLHTGANSPLAGMIGTRMQDVGGLVRDDLEHADRGSWDAVLARFDEAHGVTFALFSEAGGQLAGRTVDLPAEIRTLLERRSAALGQFLPPPAPPGAAPDAPPPAALPPDAAPPDGPPPDPRDPRPFAPQAAAARPVDPLPPDGLPWPPGPHHGPPPWASSSIPLDFALHTSDPSLYWAGMALPVAVPSERRMVPAVLLARSESMTGHGLFFSPWPWLALAAVVAVLSLLVWFPLARSLSRPLAEMSRVASRIATGRFDLKLDADRTDEIGTLAAAINDMSDRLDGLVNGQKRFLGDVAHELASPLARIRLAAGILEDGLAEADRWRMASLQEEVQSLADLVDELLSFARAENTPDRIVPVEVPVAEAVSKAVRREAIGAEVRVDVPEDLVAMARPELLTRALANLLRNAVRYAGDAGPITVTGWRDGGQVSLSVRDRGRGVPEEHLSRIFDPFHRLDEARTRESGGTGLGLAIVKTCVTSCGGSVDAANAFPHGLVVTVTLPSAPRG